jgi:ribosomal protein S3
MWTRRLREFPGDVVFETLTNWRQKWFPAWTELVDVLEEKTQARRFIAAKLEELP